MLSGKRILNGVLIVIPLLMIPAAWYLDRDGYRPWNFIALMFLMLLFVATLGVRISGRPAGILINERNLVSLARFQLVMWTILILSAFMAAAIGRIRGRADLGNASNIGL